MTGQTSCGLTRLGAASDPRGCVPSSVETLAEGIDGTADEGIADRNAHHPVRPLHAVALSQIQIVPENDRADRVLFKIEREAERPVGKGQHLLGHAAGEAVDLGDTVADLDDRAFFHHRELGPPLSELLLEKRDDLFSLDLHGCTHVQSPAP